MRSRQILVAAALVVIVTSGCGGDATTTANPTSPTATCAFGVSPSSIAAPAGGGTFSVSVSTGATCSWQAISSVSWIGFSTSNGVTVGASGTGSVTLALVVGPNGVGSRSASIAVADQTLGVQQSGASAPPPAPTTATMSITVDGATCSGRAMNITVFIDGQTAGTIQPGAGTVSKEVSIGNHTIAARSSNGVNWPTITVAVPANGYSSRLTCTT